MDVGCVLWCFGVELWMKMHEVDCGLLVWGAGCGEMI